MNNCAHFSSFQYVTKNNSELHQRAIPKQAPVLTIVDERDDSVERQVERIPTIDPAVTKDEAQPEISTLKPTTEDVAVRKDSVSSTVVTSDETPHFPAETEEKQARLDRQWKPLKVHVDDLPDIYARLSKIKLTGRVHITLYMEYVVFLSYTLTCHSHS